MTDINHGKFERDSDGWIVFDDSMWKSYFPNETTYDRVLVLKKDGRITGHRNMGCGVSKTETFFCLDDAKDWVLNGKATRIECPRCGHRWSKP